MSTYRDGEPCPRCKGRATTSEGECRSCGALWGDAFLCAHCGAHTKARPDPLVRAACPACGGPRLGAELGRDDYEGVLARVRSYRLWHARAVVYIPSVAGLAGVGVAVASSYLSASMQLARHDYLAEHGPASVASAPSAPALPSPAISFVVVVFVVGVLGLAIHLAGAAWLRQRVRSEAERLALGAK
jgi:hypothetical protein